MSSLVHSVACLCEASVPDVLAHIVRAEGMARWNLGMRDCTEADGGLLRGVSLFDGSTGWVRKQVMADGLVDSWVGSAPDALSHRISARVLPGERLGYPAGTTLLTLTAWRPQGMSDARWERLRAAHDAEILLIQSQLAVRSPETQA